MHSTITTNLGNRAINLNFAQFTKIIYLLKASRLLKNVTWGRGAPGNFPVSRWASPLLDYALSLYEKVLRRAVDFGLQFKPSKHKFSSTNLEILGHRVTPDCRLPTLKGTEAISACSRPHNITSIKRFLALVCYFREYIPSLSKFAEFT